MTYLAARHVAGLASAVALLAVAGASPGAAQDKIVWNHNFFGPKREVTRGIEKTAEMMNAAGGGKFELKIHYGAALGPPKAVPEAIKTGGYEAGNLCVGYAPNKFPLLSVMELPFLAPVATATRAKLDDIILEHPDIKKEMGTRWNMMALEAAPLPAYEFMGNKKIASTDDMKGVKMRISGLNAKALAKFGAVPTNVPAPEAYTALERGTIDMIGFPYSYTFGAYRIYEVSKHSTEGMAMSGFMCFQGLSLDAWKKLPDNLKKMLPEVRKASTAALLEAYEEADKKWIPVYKERLEVHQFPAAERQKLQATAGEIWEEWVKDQEKAGRPGKKILDFVKAEIAKL